MKTKKLSRSIIVFVILSQLYITAAGQDAAVPADVLSPSYWKAQALNDIIPFWEKSIDSDDSGFYTEINEDGTPWGPGKKYPRMNSRAVFGFSAAYMLSGDPKYLEFAAHGMKYLADYGWDKEYGGWHQSTDESGEPDNDGKNLFDETYGCLGPIMYYMATGDKQALSFVQKTHALMQSKAWDKKNGGYWARVDRQWNKVTGNKSFNSQIDTCTAYLIYYYLATKDTALLADFKQLCNSVVKHMVNPKTGFVGEWFTEDWTSRESTLWAGHNLKTGWVLMRAYNLTGDKKYLEAAQKIAKAQIKYTWDEKYGGWFFRFQRDDPSMAEMEKDWWTQEEGNMLMLNLYRHTAGRDYLDKFKKSAEFWDKFFIDRKNGECWQGLSREGEVVKKIKGDLFKSAYHTMEQALFSYLYLGLYVNKSVAELYFNLSADAAGEKHYVNLLEDPAVIIKSVEIDGKPHAEFNAKEGYIALPQGNGMKVKVIFTVK